MEILQLKYFCDACKNQNFSKTAKKYSVPASNISQTIKRLENELGVQLFDRKANSLTLNETGEQFYEKISTALELIESAKRDIVKKDETIKICITTNRRIIMNIIEKFNKSFPGVTIIICHEDVGDEYDLIISDDRYAASGMKRELIISEEISLAISNSNPLSEKETIKASDIEAEPFIAMHSTSSQYAVTQKICADLGFTPKIVIQSDDPFYIRKCVELGLGITFVPVFSWQGQFSENISIKNIGSYKRNTYAYIGKKASGIIYEFLNMLICETRI